MRKDECLTIRADMIDTHPDGVPGWLIDHSIEDATKFMELRDRGFILLGLNPGDDPEDLFED